MKITFLGGIEEVTGSKYLIEHEKTKILVDCGMFQGGKELRMRNWDAFPVDPETIDAVIVTHAHIDHTGYIPVIVKQGFKGTVYCSKGTFALSSLLLIDSGMLQEEDAKRANKYGYSSHKPALPLYTAADAQYALSFFKVIDFDKPFTINDLYITLIASHHILGSSFVVVSDRKKTVTFSGDLGRPHDLVMKAPPYIKSTDYLVLESTYGDRLHDEEDPVGSLGGVINKTIKRGGTIVIPAFAVGRSQSILYCLYQLQLKNQIPRNIPIFLDSPMAINVSNLYCSFNDEHRLSTGACPIIFDIATYTRTVAESKHIDQIEGPRIILSASGMATGGRVLHHIKYFIEDPKSTILFVGFQGEGTLGRVLLEGEKQVRIYGQTYDVRAHIEKIDTLSAHADYNEVLEWLSHFEKKPKKVFLTHGELGSAESLQKKIVERFGWSVVVPRYLESFDLE